MTSRRIVTISTLAAALALPLGCAEEEGAVEQGASVSDRATPAAPAWLLASAPAEARPVAEVKQSAKEGDRVAIRGVIGGRADPMSADSAMFIIIDPSVPSCAEMPDDACPKPWDYCCESPESLAANNASVQLVSEDGRPLAIDLRKHGLEPLDEVIVVGEVGARPAAEVLTIRGTGLHKVGG